MGVRNKACKRCINGCIKVNWKNKLVWDHGVYKPNFIVNQEVSVFRVNREIQQEINLLRFWFFFFQKPIYKCNSVSNDTRQLRETNKQDSLGLKKVDRRRVKN